MSRRETIRRIMARQDAERCGFWLYHSPNAALAGLLPV